MEYKSDRGMNYEVACKLGMNEALILNQIMYLESNTNFIEDNKKWVYMRLEDMQAKHFKFMSLSTMKRSLATLTKLGILDSCKPHLGDWLHTKAYAINGEKLHEVMGWEWTPTPVFEKPVHPRLRGKKKTEKKSIRKEMVSDYMREAIDSQLEPNAKKHQEELISPKAKKHQEELISPKAKNYREDLRKIGVPV